MIEQEYGIKTKPSPPGNSQANANIERIHQVLGNLVHTYNLQETYVDDADPCMGIPATAAFAVRSTYHRTIQKSPVQLVLWRDMIPPIDHIANLRYICQREKMQIEKDVIRKKITRTDHYYRIGDKAMVRRNRLINTKHRFKVRLK